MQPIHTIQVPATVQTILAARIDRLAPEDKHLLQTASVVGKDMPFILLQAIAGLPEGALRSALDRLQAAEFVYETGLFPDLEYSFKHALTHEVAYSGLLQERRRELHARIVDAIETLHRDRLGEQIERLAHHALRGDLGERAVQYLRQAGNKANARLVLAEARSWLEQALGALEAMSATRSRLEHAYDIRLELVHPISNLGEIRRGLERLREAEALAEQLDDDRRRGRVYGMSTNVHSQLGELDNALMTGGRALEIAGRLGDSRLRVLATSYLEQAHYFRGDYERAVELGTDNLAALPPESVYEHFGLGAPASVFARAWLVMSLAELGRFAEAAAPAAEALRLAESTHHAYSIGYAHRAAGTLDLLKGDWAKARPRIERWVAETRPGTIVLPLGMRPLFSHCHLGLGKLYRRTGKPEQAREHLVTATTMYREMAMTYWLEKAEAETRELG